MKTNKNITFKKCKILSKDFSIYVPVYSYVFELYEDGKFIEDQFIDVFDKKCVSNYLMGFYHMHTVWSLADDKLFKASFLNAPEIPLEELQNPGKFLEKAGNIGEVTLKNGVCIHLPEENKNNRKQVNNYKEIEQIEAKVKKLLKRRNTLYKHEDTGDMKRNWKYVADLALEKFIRKAG